MRLLREGRPPVVARVEDERVMFDPAHCGPPDEDMELLAALRGINA